jgi:hypothetical protein
MPGGAFGCLVIDPAAGERLPFGSTLLGVNMVFACAFSAYPGLEPEKTHQQGAQVAMLCFSSM